MTFSFGQGGVTAQGVGARGRGGGRSVAGRSDKCSERDIPWAHRWPVWLSNSPMFVSSSIERRRYQDTAY